MQPRLFSPSFVHLDDGEVDLTSHIHVPAVSVQSHVSSDVLSDSKGDAAAVSSHGSSVPGKNGCVSNSMSRGSSVPVTFCRPPPRLVGSQFLNESQMQWSSAYTGAKACHARTPTKVCEVCPNDSSSGASSRRQATVESDPLSGIGGPLSDAKAGVLSETCGSVRESRGAGTRSCASPRPARWQRGGQRHQRRKRASSRAEVRTGSVWATAPLFAHAGRSFDVSRWKVRRIAPGEKSCEDTPSTTELSNRSEDVPQLCQGAPAPSGR